MNWLMCRSTPLADAAAAASAFDNDAMINEIKEAATNCHRDPDDTATKRPQAAAIPNTTNVWITVVSGPAGERPDQYAPTAYLGGG